MTTMNYLFFLGILIPSIITVILFVVFCYCWWRIKVRDQILYKKHDPHGIEKLKDGAIYEPPPPPSPPFRSTRDLSDLLSHDNNNTKKTSSDDYEESPEPTDGVDNPTLYRIAPDSGFCELNDIHCKVQGESHERAGEENRPKSEASDDSDDSGFRSSRSGQYNHSASSSNGNAQEALVGVGSCQVHDIVPLFKPIRIHPNEKDYQPYQISYGDRYSAKHRRNKQRKPVPPSHHYTTDSNINSMRPLPQPGHSNQPTNGSHVGPIFDMNQVTQSNYDVHGGRLHTIDTHIRPLHSAGTINHLNSHGHCGHLNSLDGCYGNPGFYGNHHSGQFHSLQSNGQSVHSNSIGYVSDLNHTNQICHISGPQTDFNSNKHFQPIQPDINPLRSPLLQGRNDTQIPLTFTKAMVHRPYIEELSDPSLFSVVWYKLKYQISNFSFNP